MELLPTELPPVVALQPRVFTDRRGTFVKTYHADRFRDLGLAFRPQESFFTTSARNVVRGLHFHVPPCAQTRLFYCLHGAVLDVVVDLRRGPTFGKFLARELNDRTHEMLLVPPGFAHGFLALTDPATLVYQADSTHSPAHDLGILWSSINFKWPVADPILSERDSAFPALRDFVTPF